MDATAEAIAERDSLLDEVADSERQIAALQAQQQYILSRLAEHRLPDEVEPDGTDKRWVREEVATALRLSPSSAGFRLDVAVAATRRLPDVVKLLESGETSLRHIWALCDVIGRLGDAEVAQLLDRVLDKARTQGIAEFRQSVARAVLAVRPKPYEENRQSLVDSRRVRVTHSVDGLSELYADLPVEDAVEVSAAVESLAQQWSRNPGETRTLEQLRADAFVHLVVQGGAGASGKSVIAVNVCVALSTLTSQDSEPAELVADGVPSSLGGAVVPIGADQASRLAFNPDSTWRRLLTDERGQLLEYGRSTYRPPAPLARFVRARDRQCTFPNCTRPAMRCDLDHREDWEHGGTTGEGNLHAPCERHHYLKHNTRWTVTRLDTGTTRWTSPTGRQYDSSPPPYPISQHIETERFRELEAPEDPPPF